jgi:hypothetical protein
MDVPGFEERGRCQQADEGRAPKPPSTRLHKLVRHLVRINFPFRVSRK